MGSSQPIQFPCSELREPPTASRGSSGTFTERVEWVSTWHFSVSMYCSRCQRLCVSLSLPKTSKKPLKTLRRILDESLKSKKETLFLLLLLLLLLLVRCFRRELDDRRPRRLKEQFVESRVHCETLGHGHRLPDVTRTPLKWGGRCNTWHSIGAEENPKESIQDLGNRKAMNRVAPKHCNKSQFTLKNPRPPPSRIPSRIPIRIPTKISTIQKNP